MISVLKLLPNGLFRFSWLLLLLSSQPAGALGTDQSPVPAPAICGLPSHLVAGLAADKADEPPPPADDRGYDVLNYDLDIRLDPADRTITGTVAIQVQSLRDDMAGLRLDLVEELQVDRVLVAGQPALFSHEGDSLLVDFTPALSLDQSMWLDVDWHGVPPRHGPFSAGLMFRRHDAGTPDDPSDDVPAIASVSEPWSAHSWWPCKDHPADKALVSLAVTVPENLPAVSNGRLLAIDEVEPGWLRFSWQEDYPIATYLVSVAVSDYVSWHEDCLPGSGPQVELAYDVFPHKLDDAAHDFAPTCEMIQFMTGLAGPYPFSGEKYAQVMINWGGAMEHQTATSIGAFMVTGDGYFETVIIHELAHQWFGDSLTPDRWADIWLNEGFARYCEALWIEHSRGPEAFGDFMHLIGPGIHEDLFVGEGLLSDPDPIFPNLLIYDKGAWVLHMLRQLIGEEAFFSFMASYATDPQLALNNVTTDQMIHRAEEAAGRDLGEFFTPWLETDQVPVLSAQTTTRVAEDGSPAQVELTLTQQQDPLFEFAMPVAIYSLGDRIDEQIIVSRRRQVWRWKVAGAKIDSLLLDPTGQALFRLATTQGPGLSVLGPWPNPVRPQGAVFTLSLAKEERVNAALYSIRGKRLGSWDLGQLSATGTDDLTVLSPHTWSWHPVDPQGRALASGVYWLEFRAGTHRSVRKLAVLR